MNHDNIDYRTECSMCLTISQQVAADVSSQLEKKIYICILNNEPNFSKNIISGEKCPKTL